MIAAYPVWYSLGCDVRKTVFEVFWSDHTKTASSATETSQNSESSLVASFDIFLSHNQTTKVLIRLHRHVGWFAPLLFANHRTQVFSCGGLYKRDVK